MAETITPTVLWAWIAGCGIWAWSQHRQARWHHRQPVARSWHRTRQVWHALSGVLLVALAVIMLHWPGLPIQFWLLPIPALDQPLINQGGLLLIRLAVCWLVITTLQRERSYRSGWKQQALSSERLRYWEPYYSEQVVLASSGLLSGLFVVLSGGVTGALCLTG